ncbi:DUF899 family protein [Propionibacteriaceae bacterium Y1685]
MPHHLPTQPVRLPDQLPPVVDRATWRSARDALLAREKTHTRERDAIAAARRRLPMTPVPAEATVEGPDGPVSILDVFEGRRMLAAYFHMWHDGEPWEGQCEGCTYCAVQAQSPLAYLHERDVTVAIFSQGSHAESHPFAEFMGYRTPWYSARDSAALIDGRGFGIWCFYLRDDEGQVYETYWTTGRGCEVTHWSSGLLDMTVFGRQQAWEDSPDGWPQDDDKWWRSAGRPTAQWEVTDEPAGPRGR